MPVVSAIAARSETPVAVEMHEATKVPLGFSSWRYILGAVPLGISYFPICRVK